jgi:hypothetical protein
MSRITGKRPYSFSLSNPKALKSPTSLTSCESSALLRHLADGGCHSWSAAQTMTDRAIAGQLKALAEDYERRREKVNRPGIAGGHLV